MMTSLGIVCIPRSPADGAGRIINVDTGVDRRNAGNTNLGARILLKSILNIWRISSPNEYVADWFSRMLLHKEIVALLKQGSMVDKEGEKIYVGP